MTEQNLDTIIPRGTHVKFRLQSCDRIRHFKNGEKCQYETRWLAIDGEYAGTVLTRSLWDTPNAKIMWVEWSRKLDIESIDDLCLYHCPVIEIEGVVGISEDLNGEFKNELWYIEKRLPNLKSARPAHLIASLPQSATNELDPF